ncbi:MAG TPA: FtsX-like permease family protein [Anaerolineales bacterium]|nr:FtsX-like permease family protein [Anaerolineales bacterium]
MNTSFKKVWRDLWRNKGRTLMVIMSISVGVMAVGMVVSGNILTLGQMARSHVESNPAHGLIWLSGIVDEGIIRGLERLPSVKDVEGYSNASVHWKTTLEGEWQDGHITTHADYQSQTYDRLTLKEGAWPESKRVGVEAAHIDSYNAPGIGGTVYFEINEHARPYTVIGTMRNPWEWPSPFGEEAAFYVTQKDFTRIAGFYGFDMLRITVPEYSKENVQQAVDDINEKLKPQGLSVGYSEVLHPDQHYLQDMINGVGMVLTVMAIASLALSVMLVINTINALIAQQISQIGIMKAVGSTRRQIMTMYLSAIAVYGLLSLVIAVPIGAYAGNALAKWMLYLLNVPVTPFEILPKVFLLQLFVGLLTPLLAGLYPVLQGVAIPTANAINQTGLGNGHYGRRLIDRLISGIRGIPVMAALSLRNTFRRPGRVILTLLTLTVSGAFFMMVYSTQYSFEHTIDTIFAGFGYEVEIDFEQLQLIDEVIPLIESRPNVKNAEMWVFRTANAKVPGTEGPGSEYEVFVRGVPSQSPIFKPRLTAGRMLDPMDDRAILFNQKLAGKMGLGVGDEIIIDLPDVGETRWTIVGLVFDLNGRDQNTAFANIDTLNLALGNIGRAHVAMVQGTDQSLATQQAIEADLVAFFDARAMKIGYSDVATEERANASAKFSILTQLLMMMTILMAIVGSMGLSGTLSINVIERRREIGVMRAVGASSRDVGLVFTGEGLMLGLTSWLLALPLGLGAAPAFVLALGQVIDFPAEYYPATHGVWIWLGVVIVLSIVASWVPARRATRISVNESLAYE